ncbi:MAG: hypothetical protein WAU58_18105 [Terriglobales bacterium]
MFRTFVLILALFALMAIPLCAQQSKALTVRQKPQVDSFSPNATNVCAYQFTSGSGPTYLQFCVTVNGNIVEFQSPAGVEQLAQGGSPYEGYGICDRSTGIGYWDYAYSDSENWNPPVTVTHNSTSVKIARTTSDGLWTLTQTISMVKGTNPYAKMVMALKNNSSASDEGYLVRYANAVPDNAANTAYTESYDGSWESAWGYCSYTCHNGDPYGLMLQEFGSPTPASIPYGRDGWANGTTLGPDPCNPGANLVDTITNGPGSIVYWYGLVLGKQ